MKQRFTFLFATLFAVYANAQVKIGDNPNTINANSLLELESTNKGFLPPRVALNSTASIAPLTGTVTAGMMVYSSGGTLADGYYYWNGTAWRLLETSELNTVAKSATTTLTKTETFVLASNDITLTLPAITASDNGLSITVKNVGSHTHLVTVDGDGAATIDGDTISTLTRYIGQTFVANGGNWVIKNKEKRPAHLLDVNVHSSWTTLQEVVEFLDAHMTAPTVVRLDEESYSVASTLVIDLDYPVTFQGPSYGHSTIAAASGLAGNPMFRCVSDCYFKMLQFNATTLSGYGTSANEDAIHFAGSGTYNEIKDCTFDRFYNTIYDSSNAEIWVFETDISNARRSGIMVHGNASGVIVKVAETDFIACARGINLDKATNATIQLASGGYYNATATDTAIVYNPSTFTGFASISITNNSWNNTGKYIEGFDFTRTDGRDANAILEGNAGMGDKKPYAYLTVLNNTTNTVAISPANAWAKANWGTNTSSTTCKWTIVNNKITFQPTNKRNGWFTITGNLSVDGSNRVISIGIVKNGVSTTRFGETTIRTNTANQPYPFAFVVYLENISPADYFEVYVSSNTNNDVIKIQDIQWLANAQ
ncbi:hypothetical protein FAM09_11290 [Niastella caeni]|uniref:Right-handed parallel beta-helix repeat-containing protein n=1 Tax=Niastella caeni TaxID=2569763 RepID=A0A4S8HXG0_9BACT|nr:hypothetical protein [Niastella caeni]THU40438.1 hypothetical protein FAM09_11290 [Niastella caeni]